MAHHALLYYDHASSKVYFRGASTSNWKRKYPIAKSSMVISNKGTIQMSSLENIYFKHKIEEPCKCTLNAQDQSVHTRKLQITCKAKNKIQTANTLEKSVTVCHLLALSKFWLSRQSDPA